MGFTATHMMHNATDLRVFDVSMNMIIWGIYAIVALYMLFTFFHNTMGTGGDIWDHDDDITREISELE